jgi:hypothetical protein
MRSTFEFFFLVVMAAPLALGCAASPVDDEPSREGETEPVASDREALTACVATCSYEGSKRYDYTCLGTDGVLYERRTATCPVGQFCYGHHYALLQNGRHRARVMAGICRGTPIGGDR